MKRQMTRATVVIAVLGLVAFGGTTAQAASDLPVPNTPASLQINRFQVVDSLEQPIPGASFEVRAVALIGPGQPVDFSTQAGWQAAVALVNQLNDEPSLVTPDGMTLGAPISLVTDSKGLTPITALPLGIYRIEEVTRPSGLAFTVEPAAPFWVLLPSPNPESLPSPDSQCQEALCYHLQATPKYGVPQVPTNPPTVPPTKPPTTTLPITSNNAPRLTITSGMMPRTGGDLSLLPVSIAAMITGVMIIVAARSVRHKRHF